MSRERLPEAAIAGHLAGVPLWERDGDLIRRRFELADFRGALKLLNRIGMLAEEHDHHPDLHLTGWKHLAVEFSTHSAGGLTELDFKLAREVDALAGG